MVGVHRIVWKCRQAVRIEELESAVEVDQQDKRFCGNNWNIPVVFQWSFSSTRANFWDVLEDGKASLLGHISDSQSEFLVLLCTRDVSSIECCQWIKDWRITSIVVGRSLHGVYLSLLRTDSRGNSFLTFSSSHARSIGTER